VFHSESKQLQMLIKEVFSPYKLNVAALGNVVEQLHVHHIARFKEDVAWPNPVWGFSPAIAYSNSQLLALVELLSIEDKD
jgi:diadenosine tetraphosphate (Ap4A) HIT family hydrolase